jgi:anti-sigma factor RsiW
MQCDEARALLLDLRRDRLTADEARTVREHLVSCAACTREAEADAALDEALARLPSEAAPADLRRTLERQAATATATATATPTATASATRRRVALAALAAALAFALFLFFTRKPPPLPENDAMTAEAVNDHLRILYAEPRVEIASGGIHQVKPWFAGRLDFAPAMPFGGDAEFPLEGGSVAVFVDRKAAAFVFGRRAHVITVLVFLADGLPWPGGPTEALAGGRIRATAHTLRGYHALLFRNGELGYALVSDVDPRELHTLAEKITSP